MVMVEDSSIGGDKPRWGSISLMALGIATAVILIGGYFWTYIHAAFSGDPRPDWPDEFAILAITGALAALGINRMAQRK